MKRHRAFSTTRMRACSMIQVSSAARTLVVIHCYRDSDSMIRIISARKATRKEVRSYEEGI